MLKFPFTALHNNLLVEGKYFSAIKSSQDPRAAHRDHTASQHSDSEDGGNSDCNSDVDLDIMVDSPHTSVTNDENKTDNEGKEHAIKKPRQAYLTV